MTDPTIDILLATYNGADHLVAQLDSIAGQTVADWRLIARDDGSGDDTPAILRAFQARHPARTTIVEDRDGQLGVIGNFARLLRVATADYVAFCDQDDVWIPAKLALELAKMHDLEGQHGPTTPLLVFSDLIVVDADLRTVAPSFWKYQGVRPAQCSALNKVVLGNVVTGCTTLMNRPLVDRSLPIPQQATMHDWWVALVAAAFGHVDYVPQGTVLYRQHDGNVIGAQAASRSNLPARALRVPRKYAVLKARLASIFRQARCFHETFGHALSPSDRRALELFLRMPDTDLIGRTLLAARCGSFPNGLLHGLLYLGICRNASG